MSRRARDALLSNDATHYVSIASLWEIAIKQGTGKLRLPDAASTWLIPALERANIELLPIEPTHAVSVQTLPSHHRDPFDRLIIAQAIQEKMPVLTRDREFKLYGIDVIDA